MIKVKDGYAKLIGTTYKGSADRVLLSNGGDHVIGNAGGNIPLNNGTVNTNLNADLLDGKDATYFGRRNYECEFIVGTQTGTTSSWTGVSIDSSLYDGKQIVYWLPYSCSGLVTLNLTLDGGSTTGPINCYYSGSTRLTTHYGAGNAVRLIYRVNANVNGSNYTGWWADANYVDGNTHPSAWCGTSAGTAAKTATCTNFTLKANSYLHILVRYANTAASALTLNVNSLGAKPIYINGTASSASNYTLPAGTYIVYYDGTNFYFRTDGVLPGTIEKATNATSAGKVANNLVIKLKSGTTEGTDLYTYNGSAAKTLDIKQGTGITLTAAANALTITNAGVRSIATGTTNGTISVNTNGSTANVAVKGLGSAAYTSKDNLMIYDDDPNYVAARLVTDALKQKATEKYIEYWSSQGWYNSKWGWVEAVNGFKGSLTGNASSATKLQTKRKLWGNDFDGSADVSGTLNNVTDIHIKGNINWNINNTDLFINFLTGSAYNWRIGYLGTGNGENNYLAFLSTKTGTSADGWYNALLFGCTSLNATFGGNVVAPTFQGNLDWSYITNKPTSFTPAAHDHSSLSVSTDTRDTATCPNDYNGLFKIVGIKRSGDTLGLTTDLVGGYAQVIGFRGWPNSSGGYAWEIATGSRNRIFVRSGDTTSWNKSWSALAYTTDNFPTSLIDKLTGYSKASSAADLATTDTLNAALGKLEYKADTAYDWYKSVTGTDNDDIINKWEEIVSFIDSVKEGTDILDEFVTRKTTQTITGTKTFSGGVTLSCGLNINSTHPITWNDGTYHQRIQTTDDSTTNTAVFTFQQSSNTGSSWTDLFTIKDNGHVIANKFITSGGTSSQFVKGDGSLDATSYMKVGTSSKDTAYYRTNNVNGAVWGVFSHTSAAGFSIYAPTTEGTKNQVLLSNGSGEPIWANLSALSVGSAANWGNSVSWTASTTVGSWSRILTIDSKANILLSTNWALSSQASEHLYLISIGYGTAKVVQLGCNNYSSYSSIQIRIIKETSTKHHVEVYNTYGYNSATTLSINCRATNIGTLASLTTIKTYTEGSGTVSSSLTSSYYRALNLHAEWSGNGLFYIEGTGTTAGTWLGEHSEIKSYYAGLTIAYKVPIGGASTTTLNINNLGAKTCYINTSKLTTHYGVGSVAILVYDGTYFRAADYWDGNNYAYVRQYTTDSTAAEYPLLFRYNTAAPTANGYVTEYTRYDSGITINPSTNTIKASKFQGALLTSTVNDLFVEVPYHLVYLSYMSSNLFNTSFNPTAYNNCVINLSRHELSGYVSLLGFNGTGMYLRTFNGKTPDIDTAWEKVLTSSNYTSYLGYIGTTAILSTSKALALTGITDLTMSGTLKITNSSRVEHLMFGRGGYNYISAPSGGIIGFMVNGKTGCTSANCELVILDGSLHPGTNNVTSLGKDDLRWSNIYSEGDVHSKTQFIASNSNGSVSLLTSTNRGVYDVTNDSWIIYLTKAADHVYVPKWSSKGSSTLPVYFNSSGEPVVCTDYTGLLTDLSSNETTNLSITVGGTTKSVTNSYSGYLKLHDIRSTAHLPNASVYPQHYITGWFNNTDMPISSWTSGLTIKGWTTDYAVWQLASFSGNGDVINTRRDLYFRHGRNDAWGTWKTIIDSENYKSIIGNGSFWKVNNKTYNLNAAGTGAASEDIYLEMWRGTAASWKMLNNGGNLKFQCNYTSTVGSYYNAFTIAYNTGNVWIKGTATVEGGVVQSSKGRLTLTAPNTGIDLKFNNDNTKSVILNSTAFKPYDEANDKLTLGSSSARWKNIYACTCLDITNANGGVDLGMKVTGKDNLIGFIIGSSNNNRGIYDYTNSNWILVKDANNIIQIPTTLTTSTVRFNNKLTVDTIGRIVPYSTDLRNAGVYGIYDSTKVGHVWSMGTTYSIAADGSSTGNMYGLVYFHTNWSNSTTYNTATREDVLITEVDSYAGGHLIAHVVKGTVNASLGDYIWARRGFKKKGSSDSYVLLGGGGHKAFGNASGNIPLSNGTVCTDLNADKIDGYNISVTSSPGTDSSTIYFVL